MDSTKKLKYYSSLLIVSAAALVSTSALADRADDLGMQFQDIGDIGNDWDSYVPSDHPYGTDSHGFGQVNYTYRIGQYEVTADQFATAYNDDNNIGIGSGSLGDFTPVTSVSWHEAAKFCNWLTTGSATNGAYLTTGGIITGIDRAQAISEYGTVYVIPNEDEWYKAAYYDANGGSEYSLFANGTDIAPDSAAANYNGANNSPWIVGTANVAEQNGTEDMNGNVWEWTESSFGGTDDVTSERALRGGYFYSVTNNLAADNRTYSVIPTSESGDFGFRVAAVPEPAILGLIAFAGGGLLWIRRVFMD